MVSQTTIVFMAVSGILAVILPVILCTVIKIKYKTSLKVALLGAAGFLVFAGILERLMHQIVLMSNVGLVIQNNIWLYALYGGLAAGVFEETSRFLIMKYMLKNEYSNKYNAIMYGAGHGGFEVIFLLGAAAINNVTYAMLINSGQTSTVLNALPEAQRVQMQAIFDSIIAAKPYELLMGHVERIPAVCLHIALSVLVWIAVTKKKTILYPLAIVLHALVDGLMVIIADAFTKNGIGVYWVELFIYALSAVACVIAYKFWKTNYKED